MTKDNYYRIEAVAKVFTIIELLARKEHWELAELSRALDMPKSTVHRMLLTLNDLGYVIQIKNGSAYALSYKLFRVGSNFIDHLNILDVIRPYCLELMQTLGETINVTIPSGTDMLVIDKQVTSKLLRQDSNIGNVFAMYPSASGKICLAFQNDEEAHDLLSIIFNDKEKRKITAKEKQIFMDDLVKAKQYLIAYDNEEIFIGVRCAAVPIFGHKNNLVAVLSLSTPTVRFLEEKSNATTQILQEAASQISLRLGASAYPPTSQK